MAIVGLIAPAAATDLTAGVVMEKMDPVQRFDYVTGIVEGLAYARFVKDGKQTTGMKCIYDWFYNTQGAMDLVEGAFGLYPDYTPGALVASLVKDKCGE